jgi:hypothetical protein
MIPKELHNFLVYLLEEEEPWDNPEVKRDCMPKTEQRFMNIALDILFSGFYVETPKHIGLSVYVYHKTRSRNILQVRNKSGSGVSYDTIRRLLVTAVDEMRTHTTADSVYVPPGIIKDTIHA